MNDDNDLSLAALYILSVLKKKGSKFRTEKLFEGEFLYDHNGEFVGVYMGDGYIKLIPEFEKKKE